MTKTYNEKLHERNKSFYSDEDNEKVYKQNILEGLKEKGVDINDQLAILFNAMTLIIDTMPESKYKTELQELLNIRSEIKTEATK